MNSPRLIWKYTLKLRFEQVIEIPSVHDALTVQLQNGDFCLWALVDPATPPRKFLIRICGTGCEDGPDPVDSYIATVQSGRSVRHFFKGGMVNG